MRTAELLMMVGTLYVVGVIGCTNGKELAQKTEPTVTEEVQEEVLEIEEMEYLNGTVTTAYESDGCNYLVQLKDPIGEGIRFLLPIGLDEEFLTHGMLLKFTYVFSRAPSGNCYIGTPAILSNVTSR